MTKLLYNNSILKTRRKELRNRMTDPEMKLWHWLKGKQFRGFRFRRQYSVGYYVLDFYCPKLRLGIEIDGDSHFTKLGKEYDKDRDAFIKAHDIKLLHFTNLEVTNNIDGVANTILNYLQ